MADAPGGVGELMTDRQSRVLARVAGGFGVFLGCVAAELPAQPALAQEAAFSEQESCAEVIRKYELYRIELAGLTTLGVSVLEPHELGLLKYCRQILGLPMLGGNTFTGQIADNESPRPLDRIYFDFNILNFGNINVHTEVIGWEHTFAGGAGSIGIRLPFYQTPFGGGFGDLSVIGKWVLKDNPVQGTLVSTGLMLTLPTNSQGFGTFAVQPYVGAFWDPYGPAFWQGFASLKFPGSGAPATVNANLGGGYVIPIINNGPGGVNAIVPTVETEFTIPVTFTGIELNLAFGAHVLFQNGLDAHIGFGVPLGSFKPYDWVATFGLTIPTNCPARPDRGPGGFGGPGSGGFGGPIGSGFGGFGGFGCPIGGGFF